MSEKFDGNDQQRTKAKTGSKDRQPVKKQIDKSESITEDIPTDAGGDASSVKLDLDKSFNDRHLLNLDLGASTDHLHTAGTPRGAPIDSARTMADISESVLPANYDESSVTAQLPGKLDSEAAKQSRHASVVSGGASYADDFSSAVAATDEKHKSSAPKTVSSQQFDDSVATEDDISEAALSIGDYVIIKPVLEDKPVVVDDDNGGSVQAPTDAHKGRLKTNCSLFVACDMSW